MARRGGGKPPPASAAASPPPTGQTDKASEPGFHEAVWALVRLVPRGQATSYGAVAAFLGSPRAARGVGWALSALPEESDVPWWRVVNRNGEISIKGEPGLPALQRALLEAEGVRLDAGGRVDFSICGWAGPGGAAREGTPRTAGSPGSSGSPGNSP